MQITEIPFKYTKKPKSVNRLGNRIGRGWGAPIAFPIPVRLNGILCTHFNISEYGAIRVSQLKANGKYHYLPGDRSLPTNITETKSGYMIVPWGAPMKISGCGNFVDMWEENGEVIIDFKVKSSFDLRNVYMFRTVFPIKEVNKIRVYYYHCVSGYNTYVGAVLDPEDFINWPLKENQPYMKKGLEFTIVEEEVIEEPEFTFPSHPTSPVTHNPFMPSKEQVLYEDSSIKLIKKG